VKEVLFTEPVSRVEREIERDINAINAISPNLDQKIMCVDSGL